MLTLEQRVNKLEKLIREASGNNIIYKDKLWTVYRVTSFEDAKLLGRGTDWGIAGKWNTDEYINNGVYNGEEFLIKSLKILTVDFISTLKIKMA